MPLTRRGRRDKVFERKSLQKTVAATSRHASQAVFERPEVFRPLSGSMAC